MLLMSLKLYLHRVDGAKRHAAAQQEGSHDFQHQLKAIRAVSHKLVERLEDEASRLGEA